MRITLRDWATPLVSGAFLLSSVTGILIFFHLDTGLNKTAHEWLGWALVAGAGFHLTSNFSAFKKRLQQPVTKIIIGLFATILLLSFIPVKGKEDSPSRVALEALIYSPLSVVAQVARKDTDILISDLKAEGLMITADQSIRDISSGDSELEKQALKVIFKK